MLGAVIHPDAKVGRGTRVWAFAQVRERACIGEDCVIAKGAYVDVGVVIGDRVKVQNHASIFAGVEIEDGVFVGPHACFTNDRLPRAVNPDGTLKGASDWKVMRTRVKYGASIGANATIVCGIIVGKWAMVGAGSVVVRSVPDQAIVVGNPARIVGWICSCGHRISREDVGQPCTHVNGASEAAAQ